MKIVFIIGQAEIVFADMFLCFFIIICVSNEKDKEDGETNNLNIHNISI
jgi:hypothetical protein